MDYPRLKTIELAVSRLRKYGVERPYRMTYMTGCKTVCTVTGWNAKTLWRKARRVARRNARAVQERGV